ncbi:MAG TPA: hypothetical protein VNS50_02885 [Ginsengibacter sp.]|nr:hypothetical protein [Ginsengibacter sp.]
MKKIFVIVLLSSCLNTLQSSAQLQNTSQSAIQHPLNSDLLFQKARKQKTTGWILMGTGAGLAIAGTIVTAESVATVYYDVLINPLLDQNVTSSSSAIGPMMLLTGVASMVASVPFFIASGKNRRNAYLVIRNESESMSRQLHYKENFVSLALNITL